MTNEEANSTLDPITIVGHLRPNEDGESIDVRISYEIIRLFSEGLYQSPHKAIEELVTNSFDADADRVFVLIPRPSEESSGDSLWVIDDGFGMDKGGFTILWRVADSTKYGGAPTAKGRLPIGQFGIGKLAAYVLAWRLTHVSKVNGSYYYTSMDFHRVTTHHQYDEDTVPLTVGLHEIEEDEAKMLLGEIQDRDSTAWAALFGPNASPTWTAAALSDFKDLYGKLRSGRIFKPENRKTFPNRNFHGCLIIIRDFEMTEDFKRIRCVIVCEYAQNSITEFKQLNRGLTVAQTAYWMRDLVAKVAQWPITRSYTMQKRPLSRACPPRKWISPPFGISSCRREPIFRSL